VLFPTIPLGSAGANVIGRKYVFPGTYAVRTSTLRAVFMDLATEFGEQGFRWVFVVNGHGASNHNRALHEAGDYFRDTYAGRMVNIMGLTVPGDPVPPDPHPLTEAEQKEDGFTVHAGAIETSATLFLRPDLVGDISQAKPVTGANWRDLVELAKRPDWPGYFGSPRLATAARGAAWTGWIKIQVDYALAILDGADERQTQRRGIGGDDSLGLERDGLAHEAEVERKQQAWLKAHPPK
jgi:creatinine amidohydrolase/Fe(II)-dependent formamide hydrolase-like protein